MEAGVTVSPILEFGLIAIGLYLAGWVATRLGLASIVGFIFLGLLMGPSGVIPVYQTGPVISMFGELGLVLLLFFMGLEFSPRRFAEGGRAIVVAGTIDLANFLIGFAAAMLLGFGWLAGLFLGGITYISSSGVISKLISDRKLIAYPEAELTMGVLVYEDLAMIVVLGGLGLLTAGGGLLEFAGVAVFLAFFGIVLRYGRPYLERLLSREGESFVLLVLGLVVLFAMGADELGFPEAVAAFLFGMLMAESDHKERLEHVLLPWRDVAAAAFFLDFGLHVDLRSALGYAPVALLLALATVVVNVATGFFSGRQTGLSRRASIGHGLMLVPRGEFSLVIVGLAAGVAILPADTRAALVGLTSVYVIVLVTLGSVIFSRYGRISDLLEMVMLTPQERRLRASRRRALDAMKLE
jgi:monovalent cation:H+ antiporter-2, CPA2 family